MRIRRGGKLPGSLTVPAAHPLTLPRTSVGSQVSNEECYGAAGGHSHPGTAV